MRTEQKAHFTLDQSKCTKCGKCINVCSGMVIHFGQNGYPEMQKFESFGWKGCWKCEHCMAVCPVGAISIFNKVPENSLLPPPVEMGEYMERLIVNRRSCRRYLDKNVDIKLIDRILNAMAAAPTGGNSCSVEYTVIDDKDRVKQIRNVAYDDMEKAAKKQIYTSGFSEFFYNKLKQSEKTFRKDDMLFCGAPHLFIAHQKCVGTWADDARVDCDIATAYFELIANSFQLGTVIMSYPSDVLQELSPKARKMLGIPSDHYMKLIVGFGYPEIEYARGVQKNRERKVHRYMQE